MQPATLPPRQLSLPSAIPAAGLLHTEQANPPLRSFPLLIAGPLLHCRSAAEPERVVPGSAGSPTPSSSASPTNPPAALVPAARAPPLVPRPSLAASPTQLPASVQNIAA